MKTKILSLAVVAGALMVLPITSRAAIIGSQHDFGTNSWSAHNVCQVCHIPHESLGSASAPLWNHELPSQTYVTYQSPTFNGGVAAPQPDGPSLACLGCHDGTLAINQFAVTPYGGTGVTNISQSGAVLLGNPSANVTWGGDGVTLSHNHPISFVYDSALASADGTLEDPATYVIGTPPVYPNNSTFTNNTALLVPPVPASWTGISLTGKKLGDALLWNGSKGTEMECTSCHDPHKMVGSSASSGIMLKISGNDVNGRGSLICRNCHLK